MLILQMSSVLLMAQLSVYVTTAKKTDGLQFSDQVISFLLLAGLVVVTFTKVVILGRPKNFWNIRVFWGYPAASWNLVLVCLISKPFLLVLHCF